MVIMTWRFYVLLNSISIIQGHLDCYYKSLCPAGTCRRNDVEPTSMRRNDVGSTSEYHFDVMWRLGVQGSAA